MIIHGQWAPQWQPVVDVFAQNFASGGEEGAAFALCHKGELVVNVWAGNRSNKLAGIASAPWEESTLVNMFSAGKGLVALCVLRLIAEAKLDLDSPVANYWPEFAQGDKQTISLRDLLCHRSGLSAFHATIAGDQIFDWASMTAAVAQETPWWEPGTGQGYSAFIYGWVLGELVRRVSGYPSFNAYFQAVIAQPLGVNCHFGVPDELLSAIADTGPLKRPLGYSSAASEGADSVALGKLMKADPRGVTNRAFANPITLMTATNSREWRQAQIPAANGHGNALALARIYGDLSRGVDSQLLPMSHLPLCWSEQTFAQDKVLGLPLRFSCGFMLSQQARADCRYGYGPRGFGHPGAGGCVGFADPDAQLGFGYVTHRMGQSLLIDTRAVSLVDATYKLLAANEGNHE